MSEDAKPKIQVGKDSTGRFFIVIPMVAEISEMPKGVELIECPFINKEELHLLSELSLEKIKKLQKIIEALLEFIGVPLEKVEVAMDFLQHTIEEAIKAAWVAEKA